MIASVLLVSHDWRAVFYFGTVATACCLPLVYFCVPESVHWLSQRQPDNALNTINRSLSRMGHSQVSALPLRQNAAPNSRPLYEIFVPGMRRVTLLVTTIFFLHVLTLYFMMKWLPKIVVDMGFAASSAAGVLVWVNIGGILGGTIFGLLCYRIGIRRLLGVTLLLAAVFVASFGQAPADLTILSIVCGMAGFFAMAAMSGMYAFMAHVFPTRVRAVGTGFGIGVGRGGSIIAPIIAGVLFGAGLGLPIVAALMAMGSLLSIIVLLMVPKGGNSADGTGPVSELQSSAV
jgi:MFS family permease